MKNKCREYLPYLLMIVLISIVASSYEFMMKSDGYNGKLIGKPAHIFNLNSIDDKKVSLKDYYGRFVLLTFGFSRCSDVCPINLQKFKEISSRLSNQINLDFIFISFDNIRDDKKSVNEFLELFDMHRLSGLIDGEDLAIDIANKYYNNLSLDLGKIKEDDDYQVKHNGFVYLINPYGELVLLYTDTNIKAEKIVDDYNLLISQKD